MIIVTLANGQAVKIPKAIKAAIGINFHHIRVLEVSGPVQSSTGDLRELRSFGEFATDGVNGAVGWHYEDDPDIVCPVKTTIGAESIKSLESVASKLAEALVNVGAQAKVRAKS